MTAFRVGSATDVGRVRANNQDTLLVAEPLFAVADGMGGHAAGEVASQTAVTALAEAWTAGPHTADGLAEAVRQANRAVWTQGQSDAALRGMGTTVVAVALVEPAGADPGTDPGTGPAADEVAVAHVGDSRVYRLRSGELDQLTTDHSLVAELVAEGRLDEDEAEFHPQRHVLTRALGVDHDVHVDLMTVDPFVGDRFLLCSDGLSREVSDPGVASILRRFADPADAARELVAEARSRGGNDNITVVVVDVTDDGDRATRASARLVAEPGLVIPSELPRTGSGDDTVGLPRSPGWRARRTSRRTAGDRPASRLITARVVAFVMVIVVLLGVAAAGVGWYARASWYVGLARNQLTIYRGRPGGVLWFQPTVAQHTGVTTAQVEPRHLADLRAGVDEPSESAAHQYVVNLQREQAAARAADLPGNATTGTTTPTTTTTPASTPPTTAGALGRPGALVGASA